MSECSCNLFIAWNEKTPNPNPNPYSHFGIQGDGVMLKQPEEQPGFLLMLPLAILTRLPFACPWILSLFVSHNKRTSSTDRESQAVETWTGEHHVVLPVMWFVSGHCELDMERVEKAARSSWYLAVHEKKLTRCGRGFVAQNFLGNHPQKLFETLQALKIYGLSRPITS